MPLSYENRVRAICLHEAGQSISSIAERMKCSRVTIHKLLNRKKATGSVKDKKRTEKPRKTNKKDEHVLKLASIRNRRASSRQLANEFNESSAQKHISPRTVRRRLLEGGLKACRAKKKPLLTQAARKKTYFMGKRSRLL